MQQEDQEITESGLKKEFSLYMYDDKLGIVVLIILVSIIIGMFLLVSKSQGNSLEAPTPPAGGSLDPNLQLTNDTNASSQQNVEGINTQTVMGPEAPSLTPALSGPLAQTPTPTLSSSPTQAPTSTPTPSPTPTNTPIPTPTPTPISTETPIPTPSPTPPPGGSPTPTPTPNAAISP